MKSKIMALFAWTLLFISCANRDVEYYQRKYTKHKTYYIQAENLLKELVNENDSLFKLTVEFTGRRIVDYQYKDDKKIFQFVQFSEDNKSFFDDFMYDQDLKYVTYYRDSVRCVYSGRHQDIIIHYLSGYKPTGGYLLDTNTYLFFEGTRSY